MESNQVQTHQMTKGEPSDNKEDKVILRALVGDPNRHKPLAQHSLPNPSTTTNTTAAAAEPTHAMMYTLEPRNRSIPAKVLPKPVEVKMLPKTTETKVYYIAPKERQPSPVQDVSKIEDEPEKMMSPEHEVPKIVEYEQEPEPVAFLEPKIVSQPVLYSIVNAKNDEEVPTEKDIHLPLFHTITGSANLPLIHMNESTPQVPITTVEKTPHFYSLIGNPNIPVQSVKQNEIIPEVSKKLVPNFYTIVGSPQSPIVYEKTVQPISKVSQEPSPTLYPIVGSPTFSLPVMQSYISNPAPIMEPLKEKPFKPTPILYTIVDDKQMPNYEPIELHSRPSVPIKKEVHDPSIYGVIGSPTMPSSMTVPIKNQILPAIKQQVQPQKSPIPMFYSVIGRPISPSIDDIKNQSTRSPSKEIPVSNEDYNRPSNPSPERETHKEYLFNKARPIANPKQKRETKSQEHIIPKSETIFIPLRDHEPLPRPKRLRTTPGKLQHRDFLIPTYDPLRMCNYVSPYAYYPSKPYRERTYNPISLPPLKSTSPERKGRTPIYESPHRGQRRLPYDPWTPHSLERLPVNTKQRSRLWDFEDGVKTDVDDDGNEETSKRPKRSYRRIRIRTPWVPVW